MGNDPGFHLDYRYEYPSEKPEAVYSGELFILTDGDCTSACEDFVMPFKDNGRAKIVGGTTVGARNGVFPQPANLRHIRP